jgi:hypothetical protein
MPISSLVCQSVFRKHVYANLSVCLSVSSSIVLSVSVILRLPLISLVSPYACLSFISSFCLALSSHVHPSSFSSYYPPLNISCVLSVCLSVFLPLTTSICVFLSFCEAIDHGCLSLCLSLFLSASIFFCQFFVLHVSLTLYVYPLFDNYSSAILLYFCYFLATEDSYILTTFNPSLSLSLTHFFLSFCRFLVPSLPTHSCHISDVSETLKFMTLSLLR